MPEKPEHSLLNEYAQKYGTNKTLPAYEFTEKMLYGKKEFTAKCKFEGNITAGSAPSKNEAKRISASHMLVVLREKDSSKFTTAPKIVQAEPVIESNKLEDFDRDKLEIYLDKYLATREKDYSKFRRAFVGDMPENSEDQFQLNDDVMSPRSKMLDRLKTSGIGVVNLSNACDLFKEIVQEMELIYYAEFLETAENDRYAVVIKMNINLFTAGGIGSTAEQAIQNSCKNAIEFLYVFNN